MAFALIVRCKKCGETKVIDDYAMRYWDAFGGLFCTHCQAPGYRFPGWVKYLTALFMWGRVDGDWRILREEFYKTPIDYFDEPPDMIEGSPEDYLLERLIFQCPKCRGEIPVSVSRISHYQKGPTMALRCPNCDDHSGRDQISTEALLGAAAYNGMVADIRELFDVFPGRRLDDDIA